MDVVIDGTPLVPGDATGRALVSAEPLSFWGGYDSRTGEIIDRAHPLAGTSAAGRVLVLPSSRGSSTTTAVLLEAIHAGTAPAAIVLTAHDIFFALAAIVALELYGRTIPVVAIDEAHGARLRTGEEVTLEPSGRLTVHAAPRREGPSARADRGERSGEHRDR